MKRTEQDMRISIRIAHELVGKLQQRGIEVKRPMSQIVRFAIEDYLQRKDGAK